MKITKKLTLLFPVLSLLSLPAFADQYLTDDADTVDFKKWQFEGSATIIHAKDSPDEKGAGLEVKFGMLPNTEISLALGYEHVSQNEDEPALHGIGDSEVSIKYRFIRETMT